ncbi:MAG: hypothetical protein IKU48_04960 [Clostridia bacterium]|nr:hypothetical protein [Clostridia bacterium]
MALFDVMSKLKAIINGNTVYKESLVDTETKHFESATKTETDLDYKDRCVLVGVVRSTFQFEVLIKEKFYHIPISQVNECQFPIKYIAIYQSKRFFGKKAGIRYFGEVESCSTVKRCDIKEIPKDSQEKYLYFKIKRWQMLDNTVAAKDMDLTAFSTTLYLLKKSNDSSELVLRSREEHIFYRDLVKKVKMLVKLRKSEGGEIVYRDYTLKFTGGMVYLFFADMLEYAIGYDIFLERPTDIISNIFDYYPEL